MRDIGKNIRLLRVKQNITQDDLAEKLFVSRQTISNYETGRSRPDIDTLIRISEILGAEVQDLLYGPPAIQTRVVEKRRLALACGLLVVAAVLCEVVNAFVLSPDARYFRSGAAYSLWLLLRPCLYLVIGWTVMQGFSLLPKVRILPHNTKCAHQAIVAVVLGYFLLAAIFCAGMLWMDWRMWQHSLHDPLGLEEFRVSLSIPVVTQFGRFVTNHRNSLWAVFIPLGMLLKFSNEAPQGGSS